jgi:hypothetical protein
VIHTALQNDTEVKTKSEGEDPYRRLVIYPAGGESPSYGDGDHEEGRSSRYKDRRNEGYDGRRGRYGRDRGGSGSGYGGSSYGGGGYAGGSGGRSSSDGYGGGNSSDSGDSDSGRPEADEE